MKLTKEALSTKFEFLSLCYWKWYLPSILGYINTENKSLLPSLSRNYSSPSSLGRWKCMWILILFHILANISFFLCEIKSSPHINKIRNLTSHIPDTFDTSQELLQTYYACDGRIFILNLAKNRFELFKDQPANIRMPTTPVHNSGLNAVALGYNSAFFIANIYVSIMGVYENRNFPHNPFYGTPHIFSKGFSWEPVYDPTRK